MSKSGRVSWRFLGWITEATLLELLCQCDTEVLESHSKRAAAVHGEVVVMEATVLCLE